MIVNLHIPTALFDVFATTSPPSCIYRQHFSPLAPPFRRRPAHTDSTFHIICTYLGACVSRGIRLQTYVSRGIRISGHTYLQTCVSRGRRICRHTYLRAYVSRGIRISKHTYLGTSVRIVAPMILCHISRAFGSHPYRYLTFMDIRDLEESWRASQHSVTSLAIQVRHPACR